MVTHVSSSSLATTGADERVTSGKLPNEALAKSCEEAAQKVLQDALNNLHLVTQNNTRLPSNSKVNQLNVAIDWSSLQQARACDDLILYGDRYLDLDTFKVMDPDEAFHLVNSLARKGAFLPLSFCPLLLKKLSNERYGTIKQAEMLYACIKDKYLGNESSNQTDSARNVHVEMMQVYFRKDPENLALHQEKLVAIYESNKNPWTYAALMENFNVLGKYDTTIALFEKWPFDAPKNEWACLFYLTAVLNSAPKDGFKAACDDVLAKDNSVLNSSHFAAFYFEHYFDPKENFAAVLKNLDFLIDKVREDKIACDKLYRIALKAHFTVGRDVEEILTFIRRWPVAMTRPSYCTLFSKLPKIDMRSAVQEFARVAQTDAFAYVWQVIDNTIRIDLHNHALQGGGSPIYGGLSFPETSVILWHLYTYLQNVPPNSFVSIEIITGKGTKFALKRFVCDLLANQFQWNIASRPHDGFVSIKGRAHHLLHARAQLPERFV